MEEAPRVRGASRMIMEVAYFAAAIFFLASAMMDSSLASRPFLSFVDSVTGFGATFAVLTDSTMAASL